MGLVLFSLSSDPRCHLFVHNALDVAHFRCPSGCGSGWFTIAHQIIFPQESNEVSYSTTPSLFRLWDIL